MNCTALHGKIGTSFMQGIYTLDRGRMSNENIYSLLDALGASPPRAETTRDFIGTLPVEIAFPILRLLDGATLLSCATVCRRWLSVVRGDAFLRARVRAHIIYLRLERLWDLAEPVEVQRGSAQEGARTFAPRNGKYRMVRRRYSNSIGPPYDASKRRGGRYGGQAGMLSDASAPTATIATAPLPLAIPSIPVPLLPAQQGLGLVDGPTTNSTRRRPAASQGTEGTAPAAVPAPSASRRRSSLAGVGADRGRRRSFVGADEPGPSTNRRRSGLGAPSVTARRSGIMGTPSQRTAARTARRSARIKAARARLRRL